MPKFDPSMQSMLDMFVFETSDLLEKLDDILMRTEQDELGGEDVGEIFRVMHTVKGSAAMMGLTNMSTLAHSLEDLFSIIRDNPDVSYDKPTLYELLYQGSDSLKAETENLTDEAIPLGDYSELIAQVESFASVMKGEPQKNEGGSASSNAVDIFDDSDTPDTLAFCVTYSDKCAMPELRAMTLLNKITNVIRTVPEDLDADDAGDQIGAHGFLIKLKGENADDVLKRLKAGIDVKEVTQLFPKKDKPEQKANTKPAEPQPKASPTPSSISASSAPSAPKKNDDKGAIISVRLEKLDRLMRLAQEIVIAETETLHSEDLAPYRKNLGEFEKSARELKKLTDELQDMVMSVRMVPISGAFSKMNRVVRDMNKTLGKGVTLKFVGDDTEVDKSVSDMLGDPLMHLVRNAVDHGIESPDERAAAGKTEAPTVTLAAYYESNDVIITVTDNGAGMDPKALLEKAQQRGLLTKPAAEYTDKECFEFIMAAGFSTNKVVTEYSGRGVGMDVVRKNLERVGGRLEVDSRLGEGSTFTIRVPMSLSISECLGVRICEQEYAIAASSIVEVFKASSSDIVISPDGKCSVMFEGKLYRIIRLSEHFGLSPKKDISFDEGIMLICKSASSEAAFFAEDVTEDMQIVVKPFSPYLSSFGLKNAGFSGTSVLGDGSIVLVLDAGEIMKGV